MRLREVPTKMPKLVLRLFKGGTDPRTIAWACGVKVPVIEAVLRKALR